MHVICGDQTKIAAHEKRTENYEADKREEKQTAGVMDFGEFVQLNSFCRDVRRDIDTPRNYTFNEPN